MNNLQNNWKTLTSKFTENESLSIEFWHEIVNAYSSKNRHYHNLNHVNYMITLAEQYKNSLTDFDTVLFSIFYHDIFYNATNQNNEEKSAKIAENRLNSLHVPQEKIDRCDNQIIATKNHQISCDNDTNFLLDFDLAILGDTSERYSKYTKQIRKEYSIYPNFIYKRGRKKVLQHFLEMEMIFKTKEFQHNFEESARKNLKKELTALSTN